MSVNVTTEPAEITLDGTTFHLKGDPTNSPEWVALLETEVFLIGDKHDKSRAALIKALAALAETPEDAKIIKTLTVGTRTLKLGAEGYVKEVTGFPTQPSKSSTGS